MAREKIKHYHNLGEHIWDEPTEYELPEEIRKSWKRKSIEERYEHLERIPKGNYLIMDYLPAKEKDTRHFFEVMSQLEELGLEIGKTEKSMFGFKMPLAEKGEKERKLIIFRRK